MIGLLLLYGGVALLGPALSRRLGARVLFLCLVPHIATLAYLVSAWPRVAGGRSIAESHEWVPALSLGVDLRLDAFGLLMAGIISGIGVAVFFYARWYFAGRSDLGLFAGVITVFAGSMVGVVMADNLLLLYVFWELTSVTSYLLIGIDHQKGAARAAALKALLITGMGGLVMLGGFVLVGRAAGTFSLSGILATPPSGATTTVGIGLVLVGAFTKSAQVPFHSWLPGAMAAPTPVSAYLHSATMVKAGVYLIARLAPVFATVVWFWRPVVLAAGVATMLVGGYRALRETDLKLLLAYGTVSQLGLMVVLVGAGYPDLTFAGAALILAHSLFKAVLFMVVGIVDHAAHTRDLRRLHGLGRRMPLVFAVSVVAVASMVGLPAALGFLAKEAAYEALLHSGNPVVTAAVVVGSALTFAYGARFLWGAFADKPVRKEDDVALEVAAPSPAIVLPSVVLSILTLVLGVAPALGGKLVTSAATAVGRTTELPKLVLWHGFTPALGLSGLAIAVGVALFLRRGSVDRLQSRLALPAGLTTPYEHALSLLNRVADRSTGVMQNGSLPIYVGVILLTVVLLPTWRLATDGRLPSRIEFADSPVQALVALVVVAAAIGCARARRRFVAVLLLGAVGFAVAVLFIMQGAPDLALTQLLVETLALVIFVLVLRHLPEQFPRRSSRLATGLRLGVAGGVGVFVTAFAIIAAGSRTHPSAGDGLVERALPDGGGRNVVNVILTDFRAFDTVGEITVLTVAALGIIGLLLARADGGEGEEPGK